MYLRSSQPGTAGFQVPEEGSRGFLQSGEPILEEHCGRHPSPEPLLLHLRGGWNGSREDLAEYVRPGVDLVGQVFLSLVRCPHVCLEP